MPYEAKFLTDGEVLLNRGTAALVAKIVHVLYAHLIIQLFTIFAAGVIPNVGYHGDNLFGRFSVAISDSECFVIFWARAKPNIHASTNICSSTKPSIMHQPMYTALSPVSCINQCIQHFFFFHFSSWACGCSSGYKSVYSFFFCFDIRRNNQCPCRFFKQSTQALWSQNYHTETRDNILLLLYKYLLQLHRYSVT